MISMFRNFFQSKIGLPIFLIFLVVVVLAFAAGDISGSSTFGGLRGDDKVATVGDESISANELEAAANNALRRARSENPRLTMPEFVEGGGLEGELDLFIDRYAMGLFAQSYGLRAGENLVNSEILKIDAFLDFNGEFDQAAYERALRDQRITDANLRRDIGDGLLAQQILRPAFGAPQTSRTVARQYAALSLERRIGEIGLIPSDAFAPEEDPTDEQLTAYYEINQSDFVLPERRTIRFTGFGPGNVTADLTPRSEQIAARFETNADEYAASELRSISSFVVPTQEAADALVARIRSGISIEAAANEAEFQVSASELRDEATTAVETSVELANSIFAADQGDVVDPARGDFGFVIARVDNVEVIAARSLDQVSDEISAQLLVEARANALEELSEQIQDKVESGTSLADVATEFELEINVVENVLADGRQFGSFEQGIAPALRPIVDTAFQMEEGRPQLAELVAGTQFLIFDVVDITRSAAPPLDEVRDDLTFGWRRSEGNKMAEEAASRILTAVRGGETLSDAMRAENSDLTQIENISLRRSELLADQSRRVPAPLVLLFSMAVDSTKSLEEANDLGWFIVDLDRIEVDPIEDDSGLIESAQAEFSRVLVSEYNQQLMRAIRSEVGVERNEEAIEAIRQTLSGEN
ncbi:SurA N-terminal domain-containing protein [Erythrobacter sp. Alg231-14]|uniref:SurA N-terminal domain-containing protein n=1 Tax=Erythrobacter sp. Alg231-14 TaxID=1922225 RepID=UPI000D55E516